MSHKAVESNNVTPDLSGDESDYDHQVDDQNAPSDQKSGSVRPGVDVCRQKTYTVSGNMHGMGSQGQDAVPSVQGQGDRGQGDLEIGMQNNDFGIAPLLLAVDFQH